MRILVIGNGGREHVLVWKIIQSKKAEKVFCMPGNGGIAGLVEVISTINVDDHASVVHWVKENRIDLVVIGPEQPLVMGLTDVLVKEGVAVFGPNKLAAQMEGSKDFAKTLMKQYDIPTAAYATFSEFSKAMDYSYSQELPLVIKADGLAAGKGVMICETIEQVEKALKDIMLDKKFGAAGGRVVVEEFMRGEEVSVLAITDGETIYPLLSAQDHKNIFDGDKGPNTGGMGAYSPSPLVDKAMEKVIMEKILRPTVDGLKKNGIEYRGILYAGLMMTSQGPRVVEFNCRFGDPEVQVILPVLKNDIVDLMMAVVNKKLKDVVLEFEEKHTACVVMASGGYPGDYEKGKAIMGIEKLTSDVIAFHAGTALKGNSLVTAGGRVLNVVSSAGTLQEALDKIYNAIGVIHFDGMYFRKDIGWKALKKYGE